MLGPLGRQSRWRCPPVPVDCRLLWGETLPSAQKFRALGAWRAGLGLVSSAFALVFPEVVAGSPAPFSL